MNKLEFAICIGLGDNLVIRIYFDSVKHLYDEIRISHDKGVIGACRNNDTKYIGFLDELGTLLFSEKPYVFDHNDYPPIQRVRTILDLARTPKKPDLNHLLCVGTPLDIQQEYIVITTKIRCLSKGRLNQISHQLWHTLRRLSNTYKIIIMGEREVEESGEYAGSKDTIFSIYDQIIHNLPNQHLIDLTVPALGITAPDLAKIKQDCLIMSKAKCVITLGIGGNFWLAAATSNTLCYRTDDDETIDLMDNPEYPTIFVTKDWQKFVSRLEGYLP